MDALTQSFYDVMYKYKKSFSERGVRANLDAWGKNKKDLLELLRRHPDWNEDELAIVFSLSEGREIDHAMVDECKFLLGEVVDAAQLSRDERRVFNDTFSNATAEYNQTLSEQSCLAIKTCSGLKCAAGQKTSRVIGKLCSQYGIDRQPEYNKVFAQLADAFNPMKVQMTGVLSIHPCDFLEMSNKNNSWSSCHGLDHGSYQAGCLSYLSDGVSMIFFTVDDGITKDFHKHPKRARQVFCYSDNTLLQSRLYPNHSDEQVTLYRGLVQQAITTCLGAPNLWKLKTKREDINGFYSTVTGSRQYPDYSYYCKLSLLKDVEHHGLLQIGGPAHCVCCGEPYSNGLLKCGCEDLVVCADCGQTVSRSNARYQEDMFFCNTCLHICTACGKTVRGDMYPAFNQQGLLVDVCADCYQTMTEACSRCSVRTVCGLLSASRLCQRTSIIPVAA